MSKSYQPWTQDQQFLLPPAPRDWLPEGHLTWFIIDVVSPPDLSPIEGAIQNEDVEIRIIAGDTQPHLTSINPPPRKQCDRVSYGPIGLLAFIARRPGA